MKLPTLLTIFIATLFTLVTAELPVHVRPTKTKPAPLEYELPLVILICSYNNAPWVEKNLDSVFMQEYSNWRIVYFDDASTDGTPDQVMDYLTSHNLQHKCTLVANKTRGRKLKNLYTAFHHYIDDQEIIIQLDGDDWLAHDHVFSLINRIYQEHDVWMTYGNYKNVPESACVGQNMSFMHSSMVENSAFRQKEMFMHLRTFYGWLAKQIKIEDLLSVHLPDYKSQFYPASNDAATMWPMFEMAQHHFAFIEETLYCLNRTNPINGFKVDRKIQRKSATELRKKMPVYQPISQPVYNRLAKHQSSYADCVILSENNPQGVLNLLNSLENYAQGINNIWLFYQADTPELEVEYRQILMNTTNIIHNFSVTGSSLNANLHTFLKNICTEHILICKDTVELKNSVEISSCIKELERTGAYAFYLSIGQNNTTIPHQHIWDNLYASKFHAAYHAWFNTLDMTLMRKNDIQKRLAKLPDTSTICDFVSAWSNNLAVNLSTAGLFFKNSPVTGPLSYLVKSLPSLPRLSRRRPRIKIKNVEAQDNAPTHNT